MPFKDTCIFQLSQFTGTTLGSRENEYLFVSYSVGYYMVDLTLILVKSCVALIFPNDVL